MTETLPSDAPPPSDADTGPIKGAADVRLFLVLEQIQSSLSAAIAHLAGRIDGADVELAESAAFERRASKALVQISDQIAAQAETLATIKRLCEDIGNGIVQHQQRIVNLEVWRKEHGRENHCENCGYARKVEPA